MKIAGKILSIIIIVVLIVALALFTVPRLFGIKMFSVLSGSMRPAYNVGDIVYAVKTKAEDIKEKDVITYMISDGVYSTHRVVGVDKRDATPTGDPQDAYWYHVQGDANPGPDAEPIIYKNVIGVVKFSIPKVGALLTALKKPQGMIIGVTVLLAVILLSVIFNLNTGASDKNPGKKGKRKAEPSARAAFDKKSFGRPGENRTRAKPETQPESIEPKTIGRAQARDEKRVPPKGWGSGKAR